MNSFTTVQQRAIALLASGVNYRQTAIQLGITRELLRKWRNNSTFQEAVELEKKRFISNYRQELDNLRLKAIKLLSDYLDDPNIDMSQKISICFDSINTAKTIKVNYINLD